MSHRYRRPCTCNKRRHGSEQDAIAAAAERSAAVNLPITHYKCVGNKTWHITADGFQPSSLNASHARRLAYEVLLHGEVNLNEYRARVYGVARRDVNEKLWMRVSRRATQLHRAGLVVRRGVIVQLADADGLRRVIQVGAVQYLEERGQVADEQG